MQQNNTTVRLFVNKRITRIILLAAAAVLLPCQATVTGTLRTVPTPPFTNKWRRRQDADSLLRRV